MSELETITVNGKTYYSQKPSDVQYHGDIKIVVLQRGWVMIGKLERNGSECKLHQAQRRAILSQGAKRKEHGFCW